MSGNFSKQCRFLVNFRKVSVTKMNAREKYENAKYSDR